MRMQFVKTALSAYKSMARTAAIAADAVSEMTPWRSASCRCLTLVLGEGSGWS